MSLSGNVGTIRVHRRPEEAFVTDVRKCRRCGRERKISRSRTSSYCKDCRPHAIADGWIIVDEEGREIEQPAQSR